MSVTIRDAINYIDRLLIAPPGLIPGIDKQTNMLVQARSALVEKAERMNPQPLTLEELRQMVGKPVYLVCDLFGIHEWNVVGIFKPDSIKYFEGKLARVIGNRYAVFINGRALAEESYGTEWIAYRHKPEEVTQ